MHKNPLASRTFNVPTTDKRRKLIQELRRLAEKIDSQGEPANKVIVESMHELLGEAEESNMLTDEFPRVVEYARKYGYCPRGA